METPGAFVVAPELSARIQMLRGLALLLVILAHALSPHFPQEANGLSRAQVPGLSLHHFISYGLAKAGVPLFAFISGLLFFQNLPARVTPAWFLRKGRRRLTSLLTPFLLWSLLSLVGCLALQALPAGQTFVTRDWLGEDWVRGVVYRLFWMPIAYPLWFVRDLMLTLLLTPFLYLAIRGTGALLPATMLTVWLVNPFPPDPTLPWRDLRCLTFFSLGAFTAIRNFRLPDWWREFRHGLLLAWFAIAALQTVAADLWEMPSLFANKCTVLLGFAALWLNCGTDWTTRFPWLNRLGARSFFIFAGHEPLLALMRKLAFAILGYTPATVHLVYVAAPLVVLALLFPLAAYLHRTAPALYECFGGRRDAARPIPDIAQPHSAEPAPLARPTALA